MAATTTMTEAAPQTAAENTYSALALQAWLSPAYPVGSYAYSHGLETAADCGSVYDNETLSNWLNDNLRHGAGWNDAVIIYEAARLFVQKPADAHSAELAQLNALACAMSGTGELQQESLQQGAAFLSVTRKAWPHPGIETFADNVTHGAAYSVCFAIAASAHSISAGNAVRGYLFAMTANWISAAVRMNIIGQTAGQQLTAHFAPHIQTIANDAAAAALDDLGGCVFLNDIASFQHETQHARLFRS